MELNLGLIIVKLIKTKGNMVLKEKAKEIYENNKAKGFWDKERNFGEICALIISELYEALEAHRENNISNINAKEAYDGNEVNKENFEKYVKNTLQDELVDVIIRCLDALYGFGSDFSFIEDPDEPSFIGENFAEHILILNHYPIYSHENFINGFSGWQQDLYDLISSIDDLFEKESFPIDLNWHLDAKIAYNKTRQHKHGKKY